MPSAAYLLVQVVALVFVWRHGFLVWQLLATGLADPGSHGSVAMPVSSVIWTVVSFAVSLVVMGLLGRRLRRRESTVLEESPLLIRSGESSDAGERPYAGLGSGVWGRWTSGRLVMVVASLALLGLLYYLVPPLAVLLTVTIPALVLLALITWTGSQLPIGWLGMLAFLSFLTTFLVGAVETSLAQSRYGYSLMMMAMTVSLLIGLPLSWSTQSR
ncbi:MAG: hypothetical protein U0795_23705 [Pirellulales bacterium]